ncbi:hypothetical protein B0H63DRAFT_474309 [Podospora didyma]|uniref:Secreted protein n=1 Tax=Podospora didyma TaxID=330526 RepID=A0AAE0NR58_9PEZI|nr:hypothetical protein B0H63DRAFT_474309 [Podospora didyma]
MLAKLSACLTTLLLLHPPIQFHHHPRSRGRKEPWCDVCPREGRLGGGKPRSGWLTGRPSRRVAPFPPQLGPGGVS